MSLYDLAIYKNGPPWLQEAAIALFSLARKKLREGSRFDEILGETKQTQWLTSAQLRELQQARTFAILSHAQRNVPYYRHLFAQHGIHTDMMRDLADVSTIPLLTKQQVMKAGKSMLADGGWKMRFRGGTSGTTGLSLIGYRDMEAISHENAFLWRQFEWAGFQRGQKRAWIRGDVIVPVAQHHPPFWRMNRSDNMLMMSSFHLSEKNALTYIQALERFDPVMIQAYPSSIAFLARFLEAAGKKYEGHNLKSIVTTSEMLGEDQRRIIESTMGCRVFDWYGSYERVAAIGTCEHGRYHLLTDYSYVELLPQHDGTAEIVATGFFNKLMPLVRYQIGDHVVPGGRHETCSCGRAFPVIEKILGRVDDYIVTPDGRQIGMMAMMFDGLDSLIEGQVVQEDKDTLRILVVPAHKLQSKEIQDIEARARALVGPEMAINVEPVGEVERTRTGKVRMVVRKI